MSPLSRRMSRFGQTISRSVLLVIVGAWCLVPFFWLVATSFKTTSRSISNLNPLSGDFGWDNYLAVFGEGFIYNLRNSFIVAGAATALCIVLGALLAYALVRLDVRGRGLILGGVLALSLFPAISLVPPLYDLWRETGLLNTYPGLYLPYTAFALPLTVFMLTTFYAAIPYELEEAAHLDGATPFQTFWRIVLPLVGPGLFAAAIITFVTSWNEYLLASTFAPRGLEVQTVPPAIAGFTGSDPFDRPIGTITAACVVVCVPTIAIALVFQRRIVSGLTAGGLKG